MKRPYSLVWGYINLCCDVLRIHHDYFPYKQIFGLAEKQLKEDFKITVHVVDEKHNILPCRLRISNKMDITVSPLHHASYKNKPTWTVEICVLEGAVNDPNEYMINPALLDWGWLTDPDTDIQRNRHYTHNQSVSQADRPI